MRRVLAFYKFVAVADPHALQAEILAAGERLEIKGTVLLATEGVNGTVVGEAASLSRFAAQLGQHFGALPLKWSDLEPDNPGFYRYKVKVKPEIVSFGVAELDMHRNGEHVDARTWDGLLGRS